MTKGENEGNKKEIQELHKEIGKLYVDHVKEIKKSSEECFAKMTKVHDQCNSTNLKVEVADIKARMDEKEKTALAKLKEHEEIIKAKDKKLDAVVYNCTTLRVEHENCKGELKSISEKYMDCQNKLSKTWF